MKKLEHHRIAAAGAQPGGLAVEVSAAHPAASGFFSIDAKPYADIFVDGAPFGQTPLVHKSLPAGKHHIKAVRADGATKYLRRHRAGERRGGRDPRRLVIRTAR